MEAVLFLLCVLRLLPSAGTSRVQSESRSSQDLIQIIMRTALPATRRVAMLRLLPVVVLLMPLLTPGGASSAAAVSTPTSHAAPKRTWASILGLGRRKQGDILEGAYSEAVGSVEAAEEALLRDTAGKKGKKKGSAEEKILVKTTFKAHRSQSKNIDAQERDFIEFFLSTDSRPHILHARNFEQVNHNTFRCEMEPIQFFSASIVPVLDIKVDVDASKPSALIHAVSGKVKKSEQPVSENGGFSHKGEINATSFEMNTKNFVTWTKIDDKTIKITSDLSMEISMQKPAWLLVPNGMMNRVGSMILQQVLKKTLPEFLDRIGKGYYEWSRGQIV